jgi:hypothetical protein
VEWIAVVLAALALVVAVGAWRRAGVLGRRAAATAPLAALPPETPAELRSGLSTALRHVSVVRYDAFGDVSGRQSFSAAILDDNGDGLVITSLHSRAESRTLLKGIMAGAGEGLSPEEQEAVDYASGAAER